MDRAGTIARGDVLVDGRAIAAIGPDAAARITGLKETVTVLRQIWAGEPVTFEGEQLHLTNAASTPAPLAPPRVVVGAGSSRRLIRSAVEYADEVTLGRALVGRREM